jgi:hypothetical protein
MVLFSAIEDSSIWTCISKGIYFGRHSFLLFSHAAHCNSFGPGIIIRYGCPSVQEALGLVQVLSEASEQIMILEFSC